MVGDVNPHRSHRRARRALRQFLRAVRQDAQRNAVGNEPMLVNPRAPAEESCRSSRARLGLDCGHEDQAVEPLNEAQNHPFVAHDSTALSPFPPARRVRHHHVV